MFSDLEIAIASTELVHEYVGYFSTNSANFPTLLASWRGRGADYQFAMLRLV